MKPIKWIYLHTKRYIFAILVSAIFASVISGSFIVMALLSKNILDVASGTGESGIWLNVFGIIGLIAVQAILNIVINNIQVITMGKMQIEMKKRLFSMLMHKNYADITKYHSGEILNRFTSDIGIVSENVVSLIPYIASMATKLAGGFAVLIYISPSLTVLMILIGIAIACAGKLISPFYKRLHKSCQEADGGVRSFIQECVENAVVMKTIGTPFGKLSNLLDEHFVRVLKRNRINNVANTCIYVAFTASYYIGLLWGAFQMMSGRLTFGSVTAFLQIIEQIKAPIRNISGVIPMWFSMTASAERIMELESFNDEEIYEVDTDKLYKEMKYISFENISFRYKDKYILENTGIKIEKGRITAVAGQSGIGKSTIMKMLLSLYKPESGKIFIATESGKTEVSPSLRGLFAFVPQGNMLLSGTIRENLLFAKPDANDDEIEYACKTAVIWEFILKLPQGLDTLIGERGTGLSEGQLQRLSIARAILSRKPILLLDEATSALDEQTERLFIENLHRLKDRTCIFISHKLSTVSRCEKTITIRGGKFYED